MDYVYAFGVDLIQTIQNRFENYEKFFMYVNDIADPHYAVAYIFPFLSIIDSVFASEFLAVCAMAEWLNSIMKWILMEHRPYWWVKETHYYGPLNKSTPQLMNGPQTCETGPGCPSGHVMSTAAELSLIMWWILAIYSKNKTDRTTGWLKWFLWTCMTVIISVVAMARMFIATHFPHQCLLGTIFGILTAYFVSTHFVMPFLYMDEEYKKIHSTNDKSKVFKGCSYTRELRLRMLKNIMVALGLILIAFGMYWGLKFFGFDPLWSVKLAFKWCPSPSYLHFNTTPLYSFVVSTGSALGWAICVTPSVKSFRYNVRERSFVISVLSAILFQQIFQQWQESIAKENATYFYLMNFVAFTIRPLFFIRIVPSFATCRNKWKYSKAREESRNNENAKKDE